MDEVLRSTGDAVVERLALGRGSLELALRLWNDEIVLLRAEGVTFLEDRGTWECDAIVRQPDLDELGGRGFGVVDTDGVVTLRFRATSFYPNE